jgi:hypothetical protein
MSAINPASFASPSLGLQAPSGIGPGAVGVSRTTQGERRPQQTEPPSYGITQSRPDYPGAFSQPFSSGLGRGTMPPTAFQPSGYTYGYSPFGAAPRNMAVSPSGFVPMDSFGAFPTPTDYQGLPNRFPSPHGTNHGTTPMHENNDFSRNSTGLPTPSEAWISSFQGLSMNTR